MGIALAMLLALNAPAYGVERTWNGGGTDNHWTTADNWGGTAPSPGDMLLFGGTIGLTTSNDFDPDTAFAGITFNNGAGAFTLSDNSITLGGNVTNNDADRQTINLNMVLGGLGTTRTFDTAAGSITVSGGLSGAGGLIKTGGYNLTLSGGSANTYGGLTTVNTGMLTLSKTSGNALAGNLNITSGGKVTFGGDNQIADTAAVTMSGVGSVFNGDGNNTGYRTIVERIASLTLTGGIFVTGPSGTQWTVTGAGSFTGGEGKTIFVGNSGAVLSFGSLSLTAMNGTAGLGDNNFTLYGNSTSVRSTITVGSGGLTLNGSLLSLRRGTDANTMGSRLVLDGNVTTAGSTTSSIREDTSGGTNGAVGVELSSTAGTVDRTFDVGGGGANLTISVPITNGAATTANITKTGPGTLVLSGNNTYNGKTTVSRGVLKITSATALGATDGITELFTDGQLIDLVQLEVAGGITVGETFAKTGGVGPGSKGLIYSSSGDNVFTQAIDLSWAAGTRLNVAANSSLTFNGKVTMPEAFRKLGAGTLIFTHETPGLSRVAYIGDADLGSHGGTVLLGHDQGLGTAPIEFATAGGLGSSSSAARTLANAMAISTTGTVTLGTADSGNLTVSGNVTLGQDATIAVANASSTLSGIVSGASKSLTKTGAGTLVLSGANTYSGNTTVNQGTLLVNGSHTGAGAYQVLGGATLGGSHDPGEAIHTSGVNVQAGGILSPGNSIGAFHIDGPVTIGQTTGLGIWIVEYDGTGAGSIDLVTVSGALDITNTAVVFQRLSADLKGLSPYVLATYGSLVGSQFSTITDLPSGYRIDYAYAGNQIALVSLAVPEPSSLAYLAVPGLISIGLARWRRGGMSNVERPNVEGMTKPQ